MLFLKNTPVGQILTIVEMMEAVEEALKEVALGRGFELPRRRIHHPSRMIFGLLPGSVRGLWERTSRPISIGTFIMKR